MKFFKLTLPVLLLAAAFTSCSNSERKSDAYGNFEAVETIVSSEASGKLIYFNVEEGMQLDSGALIAVVDTSQLYLQRQQLSSQKKVVSTKFSNVKAQTDVIEEQKKVNETEKNRIEKLLQDKAASQKQLDDINGSISVLDKQKSSVQSQNSTTKEELGNVETQIKSINDKIQKCYIVNPVKGTVLMKLTEPSEVVSFGKPLYKIADLSVLELKVYVSGAQLSSIKLGQKVKVLIDAGRETSKTLEGEISWISSKAEFTPKIVQTKEERVNLVYAVKIRVKNNGELKIGMPGEVLFD
ncbi:MAG TPA: HlyD family efflux transporter periplasmic adaptor subunit [Ignavibacteria bacterium]|nr:HlyD family efflux transporter periplasmic adaptor subunit [Ignavibacteria bacterium]